MPESPAASTPYEVLGVSPDASQTELRRAYRRLLRQTHPDTGGNPARFNAVQQAWARIGDIEARRQWDAGRTATGSSTPFASPASPAKPTGARRADTGSSVKARAYGHPGGVARERFLVLMREWADRGADLDDPYDPALVRSAPREIRHLLADALAEEATARAVSSLGIGYTIWSNVATDRGKLDHVILGPAGLFAVMSEDWGSEVRLVRGELRGDGIQPGEQPVRALARTAKALGRSVRVRFTSRLIVVPDEVIGQPITHVGKPGEAAIVQLSALPRVLRDGLTGGQRLSIEDVFDVRTRLQNGIRFV
ncbi:MAG: DnaJ domain-containing protein [Salinibacterium sp.]|nr:DnaJ domain-containing protein [Salinibacterium sp.]